MTTSFKSYYKFISDCWTVLKGYDEGSNPGDVANALYQKVYCAGGNQGKTALKGNTLNTAMSSIFTTIGAHVVWAQSVCMIDSNETATYAQDYQDNKSTDNLVKVSRSYLHVYPTGTTLKNKVKIKPDGRPKSGDVNWRVALNVDAKDVATVLPAFMSLMDNNAYTFIDHFKLATPGAVGKADTFIIYMVKPDDQVLADFLADAWKQISALVTPIDYFMPAWETIQPGFAVASNPPSGYVSFGQYRCIVAYIAYRALLMTVKDGNMKKTSRNFYMWVEDAMVRYGIPGREPHEQELLGAPFFGADEQKLFTDIWASAVKANAKNYPALLKVG